MTDDYKIKKAIEQMNNLDSRGMREMLYAIEDHKRAFASVDMTILRNTIERANYLKDITQNYCVSEHISKAMLDLRCASRMYSESIFGSEAMRQIASTSNARTREFEDSIKVEKSSVFESGRIQMDQLSTLAESITRPGWIRQIQDLSTTVKGFELASFESRFASFGRIVEQAEASMRMVQWENIASLEIAPQFCCSLEFHTEQLNHSFAGFAERMILRPESIVNAPLFVAKMPPLAVYSHAEGLRAISMVTEEEQKDDESPDRMLWNDTREETLVAIEDMLPHISNDLLVSWKGGWHTAQKKSPDWVRQAAASFRYVLITVLDIAAPHSRVKNEVKPEFLNHKGEVVRKTQVVWLCEPLRNKTYQKVVLEDLNSTISIIDAFSEAVHRSQYAKLEAAFDRIAVRVAITLQHILELYFSNGRNKS